MGLLGVCASVRQDQNWEWVCVPGAACFFNGKHVSGKGVIRCKVGVCVCVCWGILRGGGPECFLSLAKTHDAHAPWISDRPQGLGLALVWR